MPMRKLDGAGKKGIKRRPDRIRSIVPDRPGRKTARRRIVKMFDLGTTAPALLSMDVVDIIKGRAAEKRHSWGYDCKSSSERASERAPTLT
ncbi:hypothetical protein ZHAS_00021128 [Anopheles sinensis]|uniref:Uncharacterized protein n=1 Tax=Anopheles sinensis TaxID=74873 RepID=A0A084WRH9_ANOSI|nr:hypothetical protein ZHAS_00021128 [Anopheles sinensis]